MVLAKKQIQRPVEQNRRPRYESCSYAHLTFYKGKIYDGGKTVSSVNVAGIAGFLLAEN
jgi:hypothetical protein